MSMECDTRLSMMALEQRAHRPVQTRARRTNVRRYSATAAAAVAAFALMLFTRTT